MSEREKLIDAMARALFDKAWGSPAWDRQDSGTQERWRGVATAALSTIEAEAVIVPREATAKQLYDMVRAITRFSDSYRPGMKHREFHRGMLRSGFAAFVAANPYRRTE